MNRNDSSRFSMAPQVDIERSTFDRGSTVKTSFNVGQIIPFYCDEIIPGDTYKVKTSKIARMQTLKTPMMDDIFVDTYYFFVPNRIVWDHWQEFMGENTSSAWIPAVDYTVPQLTAPASTGWLPGTVADYLGVPTGVADLSVNALPFRAYALIYDAWFRDENLCDPPVIQHGDSDVTGTNGTNYVNDLAKGGYPAIAAKTHDYFTSALPAPQKGPDVKVQLANGPLPVFTQGQPNEYYAPKFALDHSWGATTMADYIDHAKNSYPVFYQTPTSNSDQNTPFPNIGAVVDYDGTGGQSAYTDQGKTVYLTSPDAGVHPFLNIKAKDIEFSGTDYQAMVPVNLMASDVSAYTTINELRKAFQIQRFYEKSARGGSRYIEIIKAHFGVTSPDARMQRPEYLGGNRLNLNVRQITQTSSTTETQPLGDVAGMSVTTDIHYDFEKSFTEHGWLIGVMVARYNHTYQQGLDRALSRKTRFDYYWPAFAHLGEQAILNKEIYAVGPIEDDHGTLISTDDGVFGYQEAWAEYRYKPNRVSGLMRSQSNSGLDSWHLADDYDSLPYLSASWIAEDKSNVDRVLQVTSAVSSQIFADILVEANATRPMPLYSIPGLIDHF